ncbi:hypothetical protein Scep_019585 [Stephania cephalantha]|uniref:Uncharacterized protein n=1 Tax=Stephania cephalantha TaxID=152367 RepID=A0AAP0IC15_9MAGN
MVPLERCLDGVSSVQWFLSFDREMFGEVVVNGPLGSPTTILECRLGFSVTLHSCPNLTSQQLIFMRIFLFLSFI